MTLKALLKEKKVTQEALAKDLGVHQTLISQWCHGKSRPNIYQVNAMAKVIGVSLEEISECFVLSKEKKR